MGKRRRVTSEGPSSKRHAANTASVNTASVGDGFTKADSSASTEQERLGLERLAGDVEWRRWGPYLSERQWGTVREDYSLDGSCWEHFPHKEANFRAYQWGEDGLFGWSDLNAQLCMTLALWNGKDCMLKERLFGLTGPQGNHGEDVKECYYYLDSTPTHSYCKALYKYPQAAFPYDQLVKENKNRSLEEPEFELMDSGVFSGDCYWDVFMEYAKDSPTDVLCQYTLCNRSSQSADIHILPQVYFRNTWSWSSCKGYKPSIKTATSHSASCENTSLGCYYFTANKLVDGVSPVLLYTDNETNFAKMSPTKAAPEHAEGSKSGSRFTKDAFHEYVINGVTGAVNPDKHGTKVAAHYHVTVAAQDSITIRCRLTKGNTPKSVSFGKQFDDIMNRRKQECELFYKQIIPGHISQEEQRVARQAYAGLCFTKQFFYYHVQEWAEGRKKTLNSDWKHMLNHDIISMPDKWEFPWYATWDLAFHMIPFVEIDPEFAKQQLLLFLSDRYMHPNGQLPAYEFNFSDVNPPVHAWACLKVYKVSQEKQGFSDTAFLKKCFHKLILNFSWWVNKKNCNDGHIFHGGFLGMDNIACVHRSDLPKGTSLEQVDGTSWMAFYCVCLLQIALELAATDDVYEEMALKFLEHYLNISDALNHSKNGLWDDKDGFYYDRLTADKKHLLKSRSLVGLSSMFATFILDSSTTSKLPAFKQKLDEVMQNRRELFNRLECQSHGDRLLLSLPQKNQVRAMLGYVMDDTEFLSSHGIRSLSKYHKDHPVEVVIEDEVHSVSYCPGESNSDMFGGNSNWRGPIWLCMNYLLLESFDTYDDFYGEELMVEYPSGSGRHKRLREVATDIRHRLVSIFLPDNSGHRPVHGKNSLYATDSHWRDLVLYYEYFHGDTGRGCGASHQTGWTALVACVLNKLAADRC